MSFTDWSQLPLSLLGRARNRTAARRWPARLEATRHGTEGRSLATTRDATHRAFAIFPPHRSLVESDEVCVRQRTIAVRRADALQVASSAAAVAEELRAGLVVCVENVRALAAITFAAVGKQGELISCAQQPIGCGDGAATLREFVTGICEVGKA